MVEGVGRGLGVAVVVLGGLLLVGPARAGTGGLVGPNSDFPDADSTMPFDASGPRQTFLTLSNVGSGPINAGWFFYDESGELLIQVTRVILGEGGTDVVDLTRVADRTFGSGGGFVEGQASDLSGRRGFAVVIGDGEPRLIGSWTIANTQTLAAFGASGAGSGLIGGLASGGTLPGTSFNPATLQDNELIIVALNPAANSTVTSLTNGNAPKSQTPLLRLTITLRGNSGNGIIATDQFSIVGSALFTTLQGLFPGSNLNSSATIDAFGDEGPGYTGTEFDPDGNAEVALIGWYGQTLGQFGTGQNLRTLVFE